MATRISRMPANCLVPRRAPAFLALAIAGLILTACSPGADYPSLFPAAHDAPTSRAETTLDANQIQQATEDLITARDRLNTEAQSAQGKNSTASPVNLNAKPSANASGKSSPRAATTAATGAVAAKKQLSTQVSGRELPGNDAGQPAGSETNSETK